MTQPEVVGLDNASTSLLTSSTPNFRNAHLIDSRDSAQSRDARLDIDALASTDELRLIIGLHLDGWTWQEIGEQLHRKTNTVEQKFLRWTRRLRRKGSSARPRIRGIY